jgi:hypothetical protein
MQRSGYYSGANINKFHVIKYKDMGTALNGPEQSPGTNIL